MDLDVHTFHLTKSSELLNSRGTSKGIHLQCLYDVCWSIQLFESIHNTIVFVVFGLELSEDLVTFK